MRRFRPRRSVFSLDALARSAPGRFALVLMTAAPLFGCALPGRGREPLPEGEYARAFEAVQRVLIDHGFVLDRIDARRGVITTRPKLSPGLFLPIDREQRTFRREIGDTLNTQQRTVRVTLPSNDADNPDDADAIAVEVVLERTARPGTRIETEEIGLTSRFSSTFFEDPEMIVPIRRDTEFEGYLRRRIAERLGDASP